jgi:hypothetical protein
MMTAAVPKMIAESEYPLRLVCAVAADDCKVGIANAASELAIVVRRFDMVPSWLNLFAVEALGIDATPRMSTDLTPMKPNRKLAPRSCQRGAC